MTDLENAMEKLINIFHQYSVRVGDFDKLSLSEFSKLVKEQFPTWKPTDPESMKIVLQSFDENKDREMDFEEFMKMLVPNIFMRAIIITENLPIHPCLISPDEVPLQTSQNFK
uniref:EF-hand domain-containing protein n=1 Tax=Monodelphis domestica TaxID=13616 RepID=A0A5F8GUM5_MONDO